MTPPDPDDAITVARPVRVEIDKIRGSRFICDLAHAADARAAGEFVDHVRSLEAAATHHCWAYRLGSGESRSADDGEPGGTAGAPILRRIERADLIDVVAVVTRYYGGTNLGTGGLIRAYGAAAGAAIAAAETVRRPRTVSLHITYPYDLSSAVEQVLASFQATIEASEYAASVSLSVRVAAAKAAGFAASMRDETAGAVVPRPTE